LKIIWSPEAVEDIGEAIDYLADRNTDAAIKLATGILSRIEQLASEPHDGPEHVLANGERLRGWPHPPFRIYYQRTTDAFLVVRIFHQRRAPITR